MGQGRSRLPIYKANNRELGHMRRKNSKTLRKRPKKTDGEEPSTKKLILSQ